MLFYDIWHTICIDIEKLIMAKRKLLDEFPGTTFAYSVRKLKSKEELNPKCTCVGSGYCYAQDKDGNIRKPCEIGVSINDIYDNADIKG